MKPLGVDKAVRAERRRSHTTMAGHRFPLRANVSEPRACTGNSGQRQRGKVLNQEGHMVTWSLVRLPIAQLWQHFASAHLCPTLSMLMMAG